MNSPITIFKSEVVDDQNLITTFQQLPQYIIAGLVGLVTGAIGTALLIGLTIIIQLSMAPTATLWPEFASFGIAAAVTGLAISWLVGWLIYRGRERCLQIAVTFGVLTSLVQTILFMFIL